MKNKFVLLFLSLLFISNITFAQVDSVSAQKLEQFERQYSGIKEDVAELKSLLKKVDEKNTNNSTSLDSVHSKIERYDTVISNFKNQIGSLSSRDEELKEGLSVLNNNIGDLSNLADSLSTETKENADYFREETGSLDSKIERVSQASNRKISSLDTELSNNTIYWISAFLLALFLSIGAYTLLRKRITNDISNLDKQILATKESLEQEGIKLDNKLVEMLDRQLKLMDEKDLNDSKSEEKDHSLALKVADEISRIQMNLNHMDPDTKGIKRLDRAVRSIIDNFNAKGYEMPKLLNKEFDSGMNMIATMEPDQDLDEGEEYIKRVIKPQVNYKGKMIQAAEVVVAFGE